MVIDIIILKRCLSGHCTPPRKPCYMHEHQVLDDLCPVGTAVCMRARNDQGSDWPICLARLLKPPFLPLPFLPLPFFFSGGSPEWPNAVQWATLKAASSST